MHFDQLQERIVTMDYIYIFAIDVMLPILLS